MQTFYNLQSHPSCIQISLHADHNGWGERSIICIISCKDSQVIYKDFNFSGLDWVSSTNVLKLHIQTILCENCEVNITFTFATLTNNSLQVNSWMLQMIHMTIKSKILIETRPIQKAFDIGLLFFIFARFRILFCKYS